MSGAQQAVFMNQRSFGPPPPGAIGSAYEGGFYAGEISTAGNGVADFYLVVSPRSSGQSQRQWKTSDTSTSGTSSVIDGPTNTANMDNASHPAAQFCAGLTIGGYSDWYMPAKNELEVCYYNLKPTTQSNNTSYGINTNAVPSRGSNYTAGTPAQTSATDFQWANTEAYNPSLDFWASTEGSSTAPWALVFNAGFLTVFAVKTTPYYVRAVRRVAV